MHMGTTVWNRGDFRAHAQNLHVGVGGSIAKRGNCLKYRYKPHDPVLFLLKKKKPSILHNAHVDANRLGFSPSWQLPPLERKNLQKLFTPTTQRNKSNIPLVWFSDKQTTHRQWEFVKVSEKTQRRSELSNGSRIGSCNRGELRRNAERSAGDSG